MECVELSGDTSSAIDLSGDSSSASQDPPSDGDGVPILSEHGDD